MMYPFMTLEDGTEIVHSEQLKNGKVKYILKLLMKKMGFTVWYVICQPMKQKIVDILKKKLSNLLIL